MKRRRFSIPKSLAEFVDREYCGALGIPDWATSKTMLVGARKARELTGLFNCRAEVTYLPAASVFDDDDDAPGHLFAVSIGVGKATQAAHFAIDDRKPDLPRQILQGLWSYAFQLEAIADGVKSKAALKGGGK